MTLFAIKKKMILELTPEEKKVVKDYLRDHFLDESASQTADRFEKEFKIPITETCITHIFVELMMECQTN